MNKESKQQSSGLLSFTDETGAEEFEKEEQINE